MADLTDEQCDAFRRLPGSFNDMVRAIYRAGMNAATPPADAALADEHVAWARYRHHAGRPATIHLCDSDAPGAFKVFHEAALRARPQGVVEGYYIACFRHSGSGKALWWGPNFAGYTPYLEQAGIYTEQEVRERGFFAELCEDVPVPVAYARGLAVSLVDTGHAKARPFWNAADLRAALAAQTAGEGKV